jgi:dihydroorotase
MATVDLLIRGGTVVDPAEGLEAVRDIAIREGRVAAVAPDLPAAEAAEVLDARGRIVTPGLIDLHVHVFAGVSHYGIDPDPWCVARGVTTAVDAGSAGADTFPGFRRYVIEVSATRLLAYLNISAAGMLDPHIGELEEIRFADVGRAVATCEEHRDLILGVKVRLTRELVGDNGLRPLHLAREAADAVGMPIMVHPQDAHGSLAEILSVMRGGDIMTHCFHGKRGGILDGEGRVLREARAAVERGVLFDVGHGQGSFSWHVAEHALAQGLPPSTISSDLHRYNIHGPVHDLATTVSKFLHLGMPLSEAIGKSTEVPARTLRQAETLGTLRPGAVADLALFDLQEGEFPLTDAEGETRLARRRLVPFATVRAGRIYRGENDARH